MLGVEKMDSANRCLGSGAKMIPGVAAICCAQQHAIFARGETLLIVKKLDGVQISAGVAVLCAPFAQAHGRQNRERLRRCGRGGGGGRRGQNRRKQEHHAQSEKDENGGNQCAHGVRTKEWGEKRASSSQV